MALRLWYARPAGNWMEALPVGNGRIGAMVFGGPRRERIALNVDTLWSGGLLGRASFAAGRDRVVTLAPPPGVTGPDELRLAAGEPRVVTFDPA
ncbi:glycoside hydrolase N-terminal domain-containing protein [Streptosporangium sandarakinum]|uniref:glycoside hydrolase N-terminal domain-containing protein n=1 Tax=Streptosporangium nondiastaticum TaxID=35764 RepID=UPI0031F87246